MDVTIMEEGGEILDPSHVTIPLRYLAMFQVLFQFSIWANPNEGTQYY